MKFPAKYWIPGSLIVAFIAAEMTLRLAFGLGNPVLVQADRDTGYRFQPNQELVRFGKKIKYNQYSQRSEPITLAKPTGKLRILMTGDSILNGGNPTDQSQTITELFESKLAASKHPAEVLNASAGSWGIGNELAYLRKFGTFQSDAVILEIGTHDLTQPTSTSDPVGHDPNYPTHPPLLAIQEALIRYGLPRLASILPVNPTPTETPPPSSTDPNRQFKQNMQMLEAIAKLVQTQKTPVFVLFVPQLDNLLPIPNTPRYQSDFLGLLMSLKVAAIDVQAAWLNQPPATIQSYFRDNLHLAVPGNQAIAELLFQQLCVTNQLPACSISSKSLTPLKQ